MDEKSEQKSKEPRRRKSPLGATARDPTGHLLLVAPVFLLYQLGLLISPQATNGVDVFTRLLGSLAGLSWPIYLALVGGLALTYFFLLRHLASSRRFDPRRFPLVLLEATAYGVLMGPVAGRLLSKLHVLGPQLASMGPLDRVVASAGAGFYEELFFRLILLAGLVWLLSFRGGLRPWLGILLAVVISSLLFSAVHYVGPGSDPFDLSSFAYRAVLGVFLALIFFFRGFATAVYAHFLYDVYVMVVLMA